MLISRTVRTPGHNPLANTYTSCSVCQHKVTISELVPQTQTLLGAGRRQLLLSVASLGLAPALCILTVPGTCSLYPHWAWHLLSVSSLGLAPAQNVGSDTLGHCTVSLCHWQTDTQTDLKEIRLWKYNATGVFGALLVLKKKSHAFWQTHFIWLPEKLFSDCTTVPLCY